MGMIKHMTAPIRSLVRFPLFQLAVVVAVILFLQAADATSAFGHIFTGLDRLVDATVQAFAAVFDVRSFTKSWLTSGFLIGYVYLACLLMLWLARLAIEAVVDLVGRHNAFWLRNAIARERGIAAYRAWLPFERIRPAEIPQSAWEEAFAWPANNEPPYPPLAHRMLLAVVSNVAVVLAIAIALQVLTPFPVLTWLGHLAKLLLG
ncbi:MAG TPA: hypothetical protein VIJ17_06160 [Pseudolabrys sp.]